MIVCPVCRGPHKPGVFPIIVHDVVVFHRVTLRHSVGGRLAARDLSDRVFPGESVDAPLRDQISLQLLQDDTAEI